MICFLLGGATALTLAIKGELSEDSNIIATPFVDEILMLVLIALLAPVVLLVARLVQRRTAGALHSVTGRIRWRWLGMCTGLACCFAIVLILAVRWLEDGFGEPILTVSWPRFLGLVALLLVLVPLQAAGEEYVARGFVLQTLGAYHRWVGVIGSALIFAAMHGFGTWPGFVAVFVGAVVWALLVIRTGGLEVSIAAHAAVNLFAFVLGAAADSPDDAQTQTAADAPVEVALLLLAVDLGYALAILGLLWLLARRRPDLVPANRFVAPAITPMPSPPRLPGPPLHLGWMWPSALPYPNTFAPYPGAVAPSAAPQAAGDAAGTGSI